MKSDLETLNPTRVRLTVDVPFDELKTSLDAAYKKIGSQVTIPGFRKGKVPPRVIDQRFGRGVVLEDGGMMKNTANTHVVRHAELLPAIGFDGTFRSALVGLPDQVPVMDFIVSVGSNRGWKVRRFVDMDEAKQWLGN